MTIHHKIVLGLAIAAAFCLAMALWTVGAFAQQQCAPHEDVIRTLEGKFQETRRGMGLINEKAMMELFVSAKATWTMVVTNEAGMSCVMAAGDDWDEQAPAKPGRRM